MVMQQGGLIPDKDRLVYVRRNPATGLRYGRTFGGRMVYERKDGSVSTHRPRRPVVLYPGSITLSQAGRAGTMLAGVVKRIKKNKGLRKLL